MRQDEENDTKSVSIKAKYPFGTIEIEDIEVKPLSFDETASEPKNKYAPTKVIKTTTVSEVAVIGKMAFSMLENWANDNLSTETVLDSIDAGDFGEMCLHRKLAPYQCTVFSIVNG